MIKFSACIDICQTNIKNIESKIDQLIRLKRNLIYSTSQEEREISQKINLIVNSVQKNQIQMDKLIKELRAMLDQDNHNKDDPELRIKNNLFGAMLKKYQHTCMRFQNEESEIKNIISTKLVRAAEIAVNKVLTEEQKKEIIENPQMIQQMYENKLTGVGNIKLQNAIRDLEERHKDIKYLEKSILQVHNIIIELNKLVQLQGEMIENIEVNIYKSEDYLIKGEKFFIWKKKKRRFIRKKICLILMIILFISIILVPFILYLIKKYK